MAALQYVRTPGYNAMLIRRTFADLMLPDALIPMSHEWLSGTDAKWNGQNHQWTFPSSATLTFGYCENAKDIFRYQGAALAYCGWDELTQFDEFPYRYLFSRLRKRKDLPIPLRIRAGFNPGGIGHEWVRARFVDGQNDKRRFVPAKLEDNPHLDRETYENSLNELDPVTRAQLRHGDWNIRPEGNLFKRASFKVVDSASSNLKRTVRAWDLAATEPAPGKDPDYTAGAKLGLGEDGQVYGMDVIRVRVTPHEVERVIRQTAELDGRETAIRIEQEPGSSGKALIDHYVRDVLAGWNVVGVPATGDKVTRSLPLSAAVERGLVVLCRGSWVPNFLDEITAFPLVGHDDQVDAFVGAFAALHNIVSTSKISSSAFAISK